MNDLERALRDPRATSRGVPTTLPEFAAGTFQLGGLDAVIALTCPRRDCGLRFVVDEQYAFDHRGEGRPCFYCWRPARLP